MVEAPGLGRTAPPIRRRSGHPAGRLAAPAALLLLLVLLPSTLGVLGLLDPVLDVLARFGESGREGLEAPVAAGPGAAAAVASLSLELVQPLLEEGAGTAASPMDFSPLLALTESAPPLGFGMGGAWPGPCCPAALEEGLPPSQGTADEGAGGGADGFTGVPDGLPADDPLWSLPPSPVTAGFFPVSRVAGDGGGIAGPAFLAAPSGGAIDWTNVPLADSTQPAQVPAPWGLSLLGAGLAVLGAALRRRR